MVERAARNGAGTEVRARSARGAEGDQGEVPADLERLAHLLDNSIRLPGNIRIGVDGLIGLIPGVGDAIGALLGFYIVSRASALGVPRAVLGRMLLNVGVDTLLGAVPVVGDLFDFGYKANLRNVRLMRRAMVHRKHERRTSALVLAGVLVGIVLFVALVIALGILLARVIASAF